MCRFFPLAITAAPPHKQRHRQDNNKRLADNRMGIVEFLLPDHRGQEKSNNANLVDHEVADEPDD